MTNSTAENVRHGTHPDLSRRTVAAAYASHTEAEAAVRCLVERGVPAKAISMIGRHFEAQKDIQGFYYAAPQDHPALPGRPNLHPLDGLEEGAWAGGIFGLLAGATGFFVMLVVGAMMVLGPLAEMVAGAISGAGVGAGIGALVQGLSASGVPAEQICKHQDHLQSGGFLVAVHGNADMAERAHEILLGTGPTYLQTHSPVVQGSETHPIAGMRS